MVKLIRKESVAKNPATLKDLINIALSDPSWKPLNWIELDLSDYSRDAVTGSGLTNGVNKGVYIHKDDVKRLGSFNVNFPEILSHSVGKNTGDTLVFRPDNQSTRVLVSVPLVVIKKVWSNKFLCEVDRVIAGIIGTGNPKFYQHNYHIYTTGSNAIKGYEIPNSYYGIKEGKTSHTITDFEFDVSTVIDMSGLGGIAKVITKGNLDDSVAFELFVRLLNAEVNKRETARDREIKKGVLSIFFGALDWSVLDLEYDGVIDSEVKKLSGMIEDIKEWGYDALFPKGVRIPYTKYHLYFNTLSSVNQFLGFVGKQGFDSSMEVSQVDVKRTGEDNIYLYIPSKAREGNLHVLSILTMPTGQFKVGQAAKNDRAILNFDSNGHLSVKG